MHDAEANYIKTFESKVVKQGSDYVVLEKTAFYPEGGGQPSDRGILTWNETSGEVRKVTKSGIVKHKVAKIPPLGEDVKGKIDWKRRYAHMKMHTAQHIISGIAYDLFGARTVGNQINKKSSRLDLSPFKPNEEQLQTLEEQSNAIINAGRPVKIYTENREALLKRTDPLRSNLDLIPSSIKKLRVIEIEDFDVCPCAGTHVKNTSEIGQMRIIKTENKGKERTRVRYELTG